MESKDLSEYEDAFRKLFYDGRSKKLSPSGKTVLDYLSQVCYVMRTTSPATDGEARERLAKQAIFFDIIKMLKMDYSFLMLKAEEANERIHDDNFINLD